MLFEMVQMEDLSGEAAKIYSVVLEGDELSLLEHFVLDNSEHASDVDIMIKKLFKMGHEVGCRPQFFKANEGAPGDGMVAMRQRHMRLYCLRYDNTCIFVGSGGYKPPGIAAYQDNEVLNNQAQQMRRICASINKAIIEKDLKIHQNGDIEMINWLNLEI